MKRLASIALLIAAFTLPSVAAAQDAKTPTELCAEAVPAAEPASREFAQAESVLEAGVDYRAIFCTGAGAVYFDLYETYTPVTVNNFVFLAQQGYYNNTHFHRVIQDFMVQGGDPTNTGTGSPGYSFEDEFVGFLLFDRPGLLAMANAGPATNGSQFFITTVETPHLDFRHTIFGEVLEGQENVAGIELRDPQAATTPGTELQTVLIVSDPATVATTYTDPEAVTQQEIIDTLTAIDELLPASASQTVTGQTTDEVVNNALVDIQAAYEEYLAANNHEYRVTSEIEDCSLAEIPFMRVGYALDAFATPADAAAALADVAMIDELVTAEGFSAGTQSELLPNAYYTANTSACDMEAIAAVTYWQRGRFVARLIVVTPIESPLAPDAWLYEVVGLRLYEPVLTDILRREIR